MTADEYLEMEDDYQGYCTACREWTRDATESDAEGYDCPACGCDTVVGAGNALLLGLVEVCDG